MQLSQEGLFSLPFCVFCTLAWERESELGALPLCRPTTENECMHAHSGTSFSISWVAWQQKGKKIIGFSLAQLQFSGSTAWSSESHGVFPWTVNKFPPLSGSQNVASFLLQKCNPHGLSLHVSLGYRAQPFEAFPLKQYFVFATVILNGKYTDKLAQRTCPFVKYSSLQTASVMFYAVERHIACINQTHP